MEESDVREGALCGSAQGANTTLSVEGLNKKASPSGGAVLSILA